MGHTTRTDNGTTIRTGPGPWGTGDHNETVTVRTPDGTIRDASGPKSEHAGNVERALDRAINAKR